MSGTDYKKYILSHHLPKDYYRCIKLRARGKTYLICSRCFGLYVGFFTFLIFIFFSEFVSYRIILYLFPIPAFLDWSLHKFRIYKGNNVSRIMSGILLGIAYAGLFHTFIRNPFDFDFFVVIITYLIAGILVFKFSDSCAYQFSTATGQLK